MCTCLYAFQWSVTNNLQNFKFNFFFLSRSIWLCGTKRICFPCIYTCMWPCQPCLLHFCVTGFLLVKWNRDHQKVFNLRCQKSLQYMVHYFCSTYKCSACSLWHSVVSLQAYGFEAHSDYLRSIAVHPTQPYVLTSSGEWNRKTNFHWLAGLFWDFVNFHAIYCAKRNYMYIYWN